MQDFLATVFIVFVFVLYASVALVFVGAGIRKWVWRPLAEKFSRQHPERNYSRIKSTRCEGSPS
jgi:hypothetical protein